MKAPRGLLIHFEWNMNTEEQKIEYQKWVNHFLTHDLDVVKENGKYIIIVPHFYISETKVFNDVRYETEKKAWRAADYLRRISQVSLLKAKAQASEAMRFNKKFDK